MKEGILTMKFSVISLSIIISITIFACKSKTENEYLTEIITLINTGNCKEAVKLSDKAIDKHPENPELFYNRGWCHISKDQRKAYSDFMKCIKINPGNSNGHKGLGTIYAMQGKYEEAEKYFLKAVKLTKDPKRKATIFSNIGKLNLDYKKNYKSAIKNYKKAIELHDRGDFYTELGNAYMMNKNKKLAAETWLEAAETKEFVEKQFKHKLFFKLASYNYKQKNKKNALDFIDRALALASENKKYQQLKKSIEKNL